MRILDARTRRIAEEERNRWISVLGSKITSREILTSILLMIPAVATTMLTYFGVSEPLSEQGGTIVEKGQALGFAVTVGIFAWLGWFYLFGVLYYLTGPRLRSALLAGVVYILSVAAIDAPFNMLALGGDTAVQLTIADTADHYEARKDAVFVQTTEMRKLRPALVAQERRFRTLGDDEVAYGVYSGSSGPGKVSAGFYQIADLLGVLVNEVEAGLETADAAQAAIATTFQELKAVTYDVGPLRPRVRRASIAADAMDDQLSNLSQFDFRVSVEATLANLETIFPAPAVANTQFESTQNAELAAVAELARSAALPLQAALEQLGDAKVQVTESRVRPQNATQAIITKWRELIFQWIAAVFIDLAPAALLIILISAYREVDLTRKYEE